MTQHDDKMRFRHMLDHAVEATEMAEGRQRQDLDADLMYEIYVQKKIDMGLKAAEAGKLVPHEEVKRRLTGR